MCIKVGIKLLRCVINYSSELVSHHATILTRRKKRIIMKLKECTRYKVINMGGFACITLRWLQFWDALCVAGSLQNDTSVQIYLRFPTCSLFFPCCVEEQKEKQLERVLLDIPLILLSI